MTPIGSHVICTFLLFQSSLPSMTALLIEPLIKMSQGIISGTSHLLHLIPSSVHPLHLSTHLSPLLDYILLAIATLTTCYLLKVLHHFFFVPFDRIKRLGDVGYGIDGSEVAGNHTAVAALMRRRKTGDVPPVYPNGWFAVIESRMLPPKASRSVFCLGKNLAVFRGEDGKANVIDAYCPHNGANLAVGGVVKDNCLECPFHGWRFQGDGKCVHIPYTEQKYIPDSAKVVSYETMEQNGSVLMWYHAEGVGSEWVPQDIPEIQNGSWKYAGRSEHIINAHIQEIPENGADLAHLGQVHGPVMTAGVDLSKAHSSWWEFSHHQWQASWKHSEKEDEKHIGRMDLLHRLWIAGKVVTPLDLEVVAMQIGPGLVHLLFESSLIGRGAYVQTVTPIEPLVQRVVHHIYVQKWVPTVVAKFFLLGEALMVERDMMIWVNKRYVSRPVFVKSKEDSLVARHRRWYSQFYSEHSPRLDVDKIMLFDW